MSEETAVSMNTSSTNGTSTTSPPAYQSASAGPLVLEPPQPTITADENRIIMPRQPGYVPRESIETMSLDELTRSPEVYNRELSWLDFNWRVLHEAMDERTPMLERLRFIAITASNLDEFFRKRVGGLKRQLAAGIENLTLPGWTPDYQLDLIADVVQTMVRTQSDCLYDEILPELTEHGLRILNYTDLEQEQRERLRAYYLRKVYPILTPLAVDSGHPFPFISNLSLNLAVLLKDPVSEETQFARLKVPPNRPRWVPLEDSMHFVPIEQLIIHNLDVLFSGMEILAAYPFRVTRNADIARNEEEADDLLEMINEELRERRFASVVRLEVDQSTPDDVRSMLQRELKLGPRDVYPIRGLMGLSDLFPLADVNLPHLKYRPWTPLTPPRFAGLDRKARPAEIFSVIRQESVLVHHPYQSFSASTQKFIESAARDPQVMAIKQTLYRTDDDSPVIQALIHAAEQGKQVAVLVELKARFDEERNISWARSLESAGCHVTYGLIGLKTHAKLSLVIRGEEDGLRTYYHIGTGNYNSKTAGLYTDMGIFGCRPDISADIMDVFNFLTGYSRQRIYRKLLVAPVNMRQRFLELMDIEIANALAGGPARIVAQMNGMDDMAMTRKLYEASQAGVQIDLIVRGNCRVRPGVPGISENIRVHSVIGRFLEHPRIYYFENNGAPRYFIGSSDWMSRNLSNRVEVVTPIENPRLQAYIRNVLQVELNDQRQRWEMLPDGRYQLRRPAPDDTGWPAQGTHETLMHYYVQTAHQFQDEVSMEYADGGQAWPNPQH